MRKNPFGLSFITIVFCQLFFCSSLFAQPKSFFTPPAMNFWKSSLHVGKSQSKSVLRPAQLSRLYNTDTHLDTSLFTRYPADFENVVVGDASWIDYDNDGDLDVMLCGWDDSAMVTKMYRNDNGSFIDIGANLAQSATGGGHGVAWGDYDNDGDYDLAVTGGLDNTNLMPISKIYRNDNGVFVDINAPIMPLIGGVASWVDYNLDGRLDLLIAGSPDNGSTFYTKLYRNDDSTFTDSGIQFPGVWGASASWGDYDNDGDPDLLLTGYGNWGVTVALFRNDITTFTYIPLSLQSVNHSSVSWGDYDNDGYLDILLAGDPPGETNTFVAIYHNLGNGTFEYVPTNLPPVSASAVAWGDYDNDGDLDIAISGWSNDSVNVTKIFRNDGGGVFTDINADLPGTFWGSLAWGDVDNDGRLDLLITGGTSAFPYDYFYNGQAGKVYPVTAIYHNNSFVANQRPSAPVNTTTSVAGNLVTFSWNDGADDHTPQHMLTYNLRVGTSPGASDIISPSSNVNTGYRREPKTGNNVHKLTRTIPLPSSTFYWSVQSVDNGYAGSPFSSEGMVDLSAGPRWQLVSLPYSYSDRHKSTLFPTAISSAFGYQPLSPGYIIQDELLSGYGYWIKFPTSTLPAPLSGGTITSTTVPVVQGWNLIGSISQTLPVSQVISQPPGIVTTQFFGYRGSYHSSDTIEPGKGYWVRVSQTGNLVLSASSSNESHAGRIRIVPTDELPPSPPGPETKELSLIPKNFLLEQNYPNPFNPSTTIRYQLPFNSHVTLKIFNTTGQVVATLIDKAENAGFKSLNWDASNMPSGLYFYRLQAGTFTDVKKLLLIK